MNIKPEKRLEERQPFSFKITEYKNREGEILLNNVLQSRSVLGENRVLVGKEMLTFILKNPDSPEAENFKDGALYHFYRTTHNDLVCLQYKQGKFTKSLHSLSDYWHKGDRFVTKEAQELAEKT
ncbi:hypothetical protein COU15_01315 [Candidatus Kaiserbacteria bacterium CG10_big_fil_rev_8_21_14_0_10_45_20]|uniref:Uncharacterized protein n=1 Tax=Candidatus Kaiserbacteria bacterium CG10_big_fil_rev_8_21_14_0_10_45_20 TaxID=1974607 RepID=A0A2H0UHT5_9BACT|nr:MAG: hypothetical protein COU15_01315 [Candidatus Kaiserbacteria bacterium CG10_big_fil_rev_8_21_14_0_10_45_20]